MEQDFFATPSNITLVFCKITQAKNQLPASVNEVFSRGWGVLISAWALLHPGPRLNIKTVLSTYGDFHVKDKTAVRTSYL